MAKQGIDIGTIPNDGTGTPLRDGGDSINDNFTELYTGAETVDADPKSTPVDADVMPIQDSEAANVKKKLSWANLKATLKTYFDTIYGDDTVTPARLHDEFYERSALGAGVDLDWAVAQTFTKALAADPTYTFSNLYVGNKFIESTGDFSPTFPSGFTYAGGTRSATGTTLYQIVCTDATTPIGYYIILKDES